MSTALPDRTRLALLVAILSLAFTGCGVDSGGGGSSDTGGFGGDTGGGGGQDTGGGGGQDTGGGGQDTGGGGGQDTGGGQTQTLTGERIYESTCSICGPSIADRPVADRIVFSHPTEGRETTRGYTWSEADGLQQLYDSTEGFAISLEYSADRVLFRTEGDPDTQRIMLYEGGELTDLGPSAADHSVAIGETVAAWSLPNGPIQVYDLEARQPVDIANVEDVSYTGQLATANAIITKDTGTMAVWQRGASEFIFPSGLAYPRNPNLSWQGDVVAWVTTQGAVQRYDAASDELVTFGENASTDYDPLVDGPRVLWFEDDRDSPYFGGDLHIWEDGQDRVLMTLEGGYGCLTIHDGVFWRRGSEGLVRYAPDGSTTTYELSPPVRSDCTMSRTHVFWADDNADLYVAPLP